MCHYVYKYNHHANSLEMKLKSKITSVALGAEKWAYSRGLGSLSSEQVVHDVWICLQKADQHFVLEIRGNLQKPEVEA